MALLHLVPKDLTTQFARCVLVATVVRVYRAEVDALYALPVNIARILSPMITPVQSARAESIAMFKEHMRED